MPKKVKIENIIRKPRGEKPGLAEVSIDDGRYFIEMNVDVFDKMPEPGSVIEAEFKLYPIGEYDIFENEEEFNKEKEGVMAPQSIIPFGSLCIGQDGWKKSSENLINGKVLDVREDDEYYIVDLESLEIIYCARYEKKSGDKPEVGNIISSAYSVEMKICKKEKKWN
ncbi:MAG: hypothetical protein IKD94_06760 [Erysipelotrichaceae bacterium]|nr:hypothetical protein [Erysipelotrichaceae bacterium]